MRYLKKLPLFHEEMTELREQSGIYHTLNSLALNIQYKKCEKDEIAIEYQSTGKTFFIIIQGSVTVFVPEQKPQLTTSVTQ